MGRCAIGICSFHARQNITLVDTGGSLWCASRQNVRAKRRCKGRKKQMLHVEGYMCSKVGVASVPMRSVPYYLIMHLKHDICLHSGIAKRRGIVDIGAPSFAVPLGRGEICPIDVGSLNSVCHWDDVRSVH